MYTFIPIGLVVVFIIYVLYLALVKKNIKSKIQTVVLPGVFFIAVWGLMYYFLLR